MTFGVDRGYFLKQRLSLDDAMVKYVFIAVQTEVKQCSKELRF
jgi:hypothetical protein